MSTNSTSTLPGLILTNGSSIISGTSTKRKTVFSDLGFPVTLNELWPGDATGLSSSSQKTPLSYGGQLGLIDFDTSIRLPRHVHIDPSGENFIHERILVLSGVALVEMNGEVYVIPPRTLVTIAPGVPHTWTACPAGVEACGSLDGDPDGNTVAPGTFLMVYEYEEPTSFRPTRQTQTLRNVSEYVECEKEGLEEIRIPKLSADQVRTKCWFVRNDQAMKLGQ